MKPDLLDRLLAARASKQSVALVWNLDRGEEWLLDADAMGSGAMPAEILTAARAVLRSDKAVRLEHAGENYFIRAFNPPPRMIVVGAVHIAQSLAEMAHLAGFEVVLLDPRQAFATEERFGAFEIRRDWPDRALAALAPDARTAVVTLTHDPKLDDPALAAALRSPAFYIGSLGSKKTHRSRLERLGERGFGKADLERIHGPVGLSIGSISPAEIAVSILAEVIAHLRSGGA